MPHPNARNLTRGILSWCACAPLLALGGCLPDTEPVQVHLNNQAPHAINATIVHTRGGDSETLVRQTIRARESGTLGPLPRPSGGSLNLVLEHADRFDAALRTPLAGGVTTYRVVKPTFSAKGPLELRSEPTEPGWTYSRALSPSARRDHEPR